MANGPQAARGEAPAALGAFVVGGGTWFRVEAPNAERVELCLFEDGQSERRHDLTRQVDGTHVTFVPGVGAGQQYGYRAHGSPGASAGSAYNPSKLLVDPWARRLAGDLSFHASQKSVDALGHPDLSDSAGAGLRSVVVAAQPAATVQRPAVPMERTVLYECHVRGMTMLHPEVPEPLRGTFLGLCQAPLIDHLKSLSVTTLSLLPVAATFVEEHLVQKGLTNYWGYAPFAAFAPDPRFATEGGDPVAEFRTMVSELHEAGLEVVLDVVFNHTGEGNRQGATLSFRGLDEAAFYARVAEPPHALRDYSGCGNSLDLTSPTCLRYVMDALRYWVEEMGVDGFRFDLATALARDQIGFALHGPFLSAIQQDPVLRHVKLIAEPWDLGDFGYRLGGFPPIFSEWNDRYRDAVRRFFRGDAGATSELATRLAGSSDLFDVAGRGPSATVNFVTSHDGFTLRDLVSYNDRHNLANGEQGRDGHGGNFSQNFGVEGATSDPEVHARRMTAARAMILCLAAAHGVPMIAHGDELGRTQQGNNNAYCQDGPLTWMDWSDNLSDELLPFTRAAFALRAQHPALRPARHMHGHGHDGRPDLSWFQPTGQLNGHHGWQQQAFAMRACGELGEALLLLLNGSDEPCRFVLPRPDRKYVWGMALSADDPQPHDGEERRVVVVASRSAALLVQRGRT